MGFFDLNIPYTDSTPPNTANSSAAKTARIKIVIKAMELGYTGIAYNRTIKGVMSDRDRCSIPLLTLSSLLKAAPFLSSSVNLHRDLLGVPRFSPFRQYTRLTVCVDNASQSQALNSGNPVLKTYDIVAVRPLNQITFDHACEKAEVDIISIDFSDRVPFRLKLPMVKAAIKRGVYFEIAYSGLIVDVQLRRQMISNAKLLVDWTRGKNVIFTSAAPSVCEVRGPNDVANLASLLGLSVERAKVAISKNCRSLLATALRRKHFFKEVIRVEAVSSSVPFDSGKPLSADWLKWDPISSGEGDLLLDDMAKSFSASSNVSKTVKAIDFDSVVDNMPSHGFQVKDLISGTKTASLATTLLSTNEPVEFSTTTNQMSEKSSTLNILPETDKALSDDRPSERLAFIFGDSQELYMANDATKALTDSEEVVTNSTTTKEEPQTQNDSHAVCASLETEGQGLQSENSSPSYEQNTVLVNEDVRIEASGNEQNVALGSLTSQDVSVMPIENEASQTSAMDIEVNAAIEISPPSEDNSLPPTQNKDTNSSKESRLDLDAETIKVDDEAVRMDTEMTHQENTPLSINNVSLAENISERISWRVPEDAAVIADQISFQQCDDEVRVKNDSLVANNENQVEVVMEEQKLGEADGKMNIPPTVLSDGPWHENAIVREPTTLPGDAGGLAGSNPCPNSDEEMKAIDISSRTIDEIQEVSLEGQKHGDHDSKNNELTLGQHISGSGHNPEVAFRCLIRVRKRLPNTPYERLKAQAPFNNNVGRFQLKQLSEMALIPNLLGNLRNTIIDPSSLDAFDPFKYMDSSSAATMLELSRLRGDQKSAIPIANPHMDWKETSEGHMFMAEVPGLKKEEVIVEIEDNSVLQISGEKNVNKEEKNDRWHCVERSSGKFSRRFRLPDNVNISHVKASLENGVLTVTVPKLETKKPEIITVQISG
ncbi:hypothetical protein COLO4_18417 [Corchorus olitorius]|uniref:SHSP domain-containing protein n=1 Tax=Corchorus olitorius TaxID=93759 RepID=A0A1R3J9C2_9ROSI|nr:hypothetical protein COLO4_18417 [Corchorus olitorius]